jgi:hypothetical protein
LKTKRARSEASDPPGSKVKMLVSCLCTGFLASITAETSLASVERNCASGYPKYGGIDVCDEKHLTCDGMYCAGLEMRALAETGDRE